MVDYSDRTSLTGQCPESRFYVPVDWICKHLPTNEMVRRLIPPREQEDRGGSF